MATVTKAEITRQLTSLKNRRDDLLLHKDSGDRNSLRVGLQNLKDQLKIVFAQLDAANADKILASLPSEI